MAEPKESKSGISFVRYGDNPEFNSITAECFAIAASDIEGLAAGSVLPASVKAAAVAKSPSNTPTSGVEIPEDVKDYKPYGDRSAFETSGRLNQHAMPGSKHAKESIVPAKKTTPIQDLSGSITPNALHYVANHSIPPNIDPKEYQLLIHGMVDHPTVFSLEDLKRLPSVSSIYFLECLANSKWLYPGKAEGEGNETAQDLHGMMSCSEWTGVPLSLVLKEVGVQKGAGWLTSDSFESMHYSYDLPMGKAMDDCLLVYAQNGEAIRPEQGYPVRLFVPGWQGPYSVKWLRQIKVVDQRYLSKLQYLHSYPRPDLKGKALWSFDQLPPKSVITRPSGGMKMPGRGYYQITGLAWSGGGAVRRVEVSTDGGKTWKNARLQEKVYKKAHTRFYLDWTWDGQETTLQSRCTDDQGIVQPTLEAMSKSWGIESKDFWRAMEANMGSGPYHNNSIQPWKIDSDGSVHNAILV